VREGGEGAGLAGEVAAAGYEDGADVVDGADGEELGKEGVRGEVKEEEATCWRGREGGSKRE